MATSCPLMLFWPLLILAATQGCCGEDQVTLYHTEEAKFAVLREVSQALQSFGNITQEALHIIQEGLSLQKQNSDALNSLPDMMLQFKEELRNNNENEQLLKRENEALHKVISIAQEIMDFKIQLSYKDEKEDKLRQEILDLKIQLDNKNQDVPNLDEYQRRVQELEQQVEELNNTLETEKPVDWSKKCDHPRLHEIKQVVQSYSKSEDWDELKTGLQAILGPNSVEYSQLESGALHNAGYSGHAHLALMLLCAEMPPDMPYRFSSTLLHGAAHGGHIQLVKQLIERGASVNIKRSYDSTPLMYAAWGGHLDVVQYLVQQGADTTPRNSRGETALDTAREYRHTSVVEYLEQLPH